MIESADRMVEDAWNELKSSSDLLTERHGNLLSAILGIEKF